MKMIVAIVQNQDAAALGRALVSANIRATKLSSTGGFLKEGNTTFLIGVATADVPRALEVVQQNCSSRKQLTLQPNMVDSLGLSSLPIPFEVTVGGATVFVLPVEEFLQY